DRPLDVTRLNALLDLLANNPEIFQDMSKKEVVTLFWSLAERLKEGFDDLAAKMSALQQPVSKSQQPSGSNSTAISGNNSAALTGTGEVMYASGGYAKPNGADSSNALVNPNVAP